MHSKGENNVAIMKLLEIMKSDMELLLREDSAHLFDMDVNQSKKVLQFLDQCKEQMKKDKQN